MPCLVFPVGAEGLPDPQRQRGIWQSHQSQSRERRSTHSREAIQFWWRWWNLSITGRIEANGESKKCPPSRSRHRLLKTSRCSLRVQEEGCVQCHWRATTCKTEVPYNLNSPIKFRIVRAHSHLPTTTQIFDVVPMSSEMGCIVINITVRTWRQKKTHRCRQVRTGPEGVFTCYVCVRVFLKSLPSFLKTQKWEVIDDCADGNLCQIE